MTNEGLVGKRKRMLESLSLVCDNSAVDVKLHRLYRLHLDYASVGVSGYTEVWSVGVKDVEVIPLGDLDGVPQVGIRGGMLMTGLPSESSEVAFLNGLPVTDIWGVGID